MSKLNIERIRTRLLQERARLLEGHDHLVEHNGIGRASDEPGVADATGDAESDLFEREKDMALHENVEGLLAKIDDALAKIAAGTYGICDECGKPIADARMTTLPYAVLCINCQSRLEG